MRAVQGLRNSRSFNLWIQRQDRAAFKQIALERTWIPTTVVILVLVAVASWAPGARTFFATDPVRAALGWVPALAATALQAWRIRRADDPLLNGEPTAWLSILLGSLAVQFFAAALVATSSGHGMWVFVALLCYAVGFHGYSHRITHQAPFALAGTVVALLLATLLATRPESRLILGMVALPAAFIEWTAGNFAVREIEARSERESLRAALQAQMLEAEAARTQWLEHRLTGVLGRNHDANNALMSALNEAETLQLGVRSPAPPPLAEIDESLTVIRDSLTHIRELSNAIRSEGRGSVRLHIEEIDADAVCLAAAAAVRAQQPQVGIDVVLPESAQTVAIAGGAPSLRSIVENLLLNACQGDGRRGATTIAVRLQPVAGGSLVQLTVDDDGPGFRQEQLDQPVTAFATTKGSGTGLGLFTAERLIRASRGTLERGRSLLGGARVVVTLHRVLPAQGGAGEPLPKGEERSV